MMDSRHWREECGVVGIAGVDAAAAGLWRGRLWIGFGNGAVPDAGDNTPNIFEDEIDRGDNHQCE